jgi:hypothetical protein
MQARRFESVTLKERRHRSLHTDTFGKAYCDCEVWRQIRCALILNQTVLLGMAEFDNGPGVEHTDPKRERVCVISVYESHSKRLAVEDRKFLEYGDLMR